MLTTRTHSVTRPMRSLRRFGKGQHGVAAVEFALVLPVVLLILLGCFEVPRYVLIYQRIARTSASVADLVSQADEPLTTPQLADVYSAAASMMAPYNLYTNGKVIITAFSNPAGTGASKTWQVQKGSGTGNTKLTGVANLPTGLSPASGEQVLAAEVYFTYTPVLSTLIYQGTTLYKSSFTRPRNDNLMTPPNNPSF
jgi:Flp pilus assembly protein TadG